MLKTIFSTKSTQRIYLLCISLAVFIIGITINGLQEVNNKSLTSVSRFGSFLPLFHFFSGFEFSHHIEHNQVYLLSLILLVALVALIRSNIQNKRLQKCNETNQELILKIQAQNKHLLESEHFKAGLISMLAHDFRTPLASAITMIDTFMEADLCKEEQGILCHSIQQEASHALHIFDNLLQWVKKQYIGYQCEKQDLPANELLQQATSMYQQTITAKGLELLNLIPNDTIIRGDKEIIQFINRNLIDNAVKNSPPGGNIMIRAERKSNEIVVSIKDQGNGMTAHQQGKLFSVSKDPMTNHTGRVKGAGLALAICKEYIDRLDGRIWSESSPEIGTTLYYAIPV